MPVALLVAGCGGGHKNTAVAPTVPATTTATTATTTTTPPPVVETTTGETITPPPYASPHRLPRKTADPKTTTAQQRQAVSYANCADVRAHGAAPIYPGDPGWSAKFDRDHDGVGCE